MLLLGKGHLRIPTVGYRLRLQIEARNGQNVLLHAMQSGCLSRDCPKQEVSQSPCDGHSLSPKAVLNFSVCCLLF